MEKRKQILLWMIPIAIGLIVLVGVSYAWLTLTLNGTKDNVITAGNLSLILDDKESVGIDMDKALPMSDEVGMSKAPYHFTLENDGNVPSNYTIYLDDIDVLEGETRLQDEVIKLGLIKDETDISLIYKYVSGIGGTYIHKLLSEIKQNEQRVLDTGIIYPSETYSYDLRLWIDSEVTDPDEIAGKVFKGKIRVVAEQIMPTPEECFDFHDESGSIGDYKCYNGNSYNLPTITDVVIPVTINGIPVKSIGCSESCGYSSGESGFSKYGGDTGYNITSVYIPDGVETINAAAFAANKLTNVRIPESVTKIGNYAFNRNKLKTITIPSSVTFIGYGAFFNNSLISVTIKGKSDISKFTSYNEPFYEAGVPCGEGYGPDCWSHSPSIAWEKEDCITHSSDHAKDDDYGDNTNPCITWEGKQ